MKKVPKPTAPGSQWSKVKRAIFVLLTAWLCGSAEAAQVRVGAGVFRPIYSNEPEQDVAAFMLDETPVTNGEFLEFVTANPRWQRSKASKLFVDERYLANWADDLTLGPNAPSENPVTQVSWFAARAYAQWKGMRLPTLAEWEWAASASESSPDGRGDTNFLARILSWYGRPASSGVRPVRSIYKNYWGAWDMHGQVWEWVEDFNSALITGESRNDSALEGGLFCGSGAAGAADVEDYAAFMRFAFRSSLKARYTTSALGFRCARDLPADSKETTK